MMQRLTLATLALIILSCAPCTAAGSVFLQNFVATFDFRGKVVIPEHV